MKTVASSTRTITCKLPAKLGAELEAAAQKEGVSKSEVVRTALEDLFRKNRKKKPPTAYDLVKDLCGSLDLPADILTNPKYMDGFGE